MKRSIAVLVALAAAFGGCGDDEEERKAETVTVTETTTTPPPTIPAPQQGGPQQDIDEPKPGEGTRTVTGVVTNGERRPGYGFFFLSPSSGGGNPMRVAVAPDLSLSSEAQRVLFDPKCSAAVEGTFKVEPAPEREEEFDWALITAKIENADC